MSQEPKRDCLPCTACCDGWLSTEIRGHVVSAGKPCPFSQPDGCGIYETRPKNPCRRFVCSWLVEKSPLPDWMRPDQAGVIVLLSLPWHGQRVISARPVGQRIPQRSLDWLKRYAQKHKRPLIYYERTRNGDHYSGLKRFGFGPPEFTKTVAQLDADASGIPFSIK